ncbi:hypothetical protein [Bradyrhizobium sp. USDA 4353]
MPQQKIRFTIAVSENDRNLFSILQRKNGDLTIGFGFAETFEFSPDNPKIVHQKYSVHKSPNSSEFNTITHEIFLSDHSMYRSTALTDAVKSNTGFQPLFIRRCPNLAIDRYLIASSDKAARARLTPIDEPMTLLYAVFVGAAGALFGPQPNIDVYERDLDYFKIVVLSHHFPLPPHRTGQFLHHVTIDPREDDGSVDKQLRNLMRGKDPESCTSHFQRASLLLAIQMIEQIKEEITDPNLLLYLDAMVIRIQARLAEFDPTVWLIGTSDDFRVQTEQQ